MNVSHKELQAAVKDLNEALGLEPKLRVIAVPAAKMADDIIQTIAPLVEDEAEIAKLAPTTIETYNKLVAVMVDASTAEDETLDESAIAEDGHSGEALAITTEEVEDDTDCFGISYDPDNPACSIEACSQAVACAEKVTGKKNKKQSPKKEKTQKGPGVIATIFSLLQQGPHSKSELVAQLMLAFPVRSEKSLMGTVNAQVPSRMSKERNVTISKNEAGQFYISS